MRADQPSSPSADPPPSLASLSGIRLTAQHQALLDDCARRNHGSRVWQGRKLAEAKDLLRLAQLSGRLRILGLDLGTDLRAELLLQVTVPCLSHPRDSLHVAPMARLGVVYREEAVSRPQPGFTFVQILEPRPVWHPHVSYDRFQVMCLGSRIAPGFPLRELILLAYMALAMVAIRLDDQDPAGLLNHESCRWYLRNLSLLPLSQEPFLLQSGTSI